MQKYENGHSLESSGMGSAVFQLFLVYGTFPCLLDRFISISIYIFVLFFYIYIVATCLGCK